MNGDTLDIVLTGEQSERFWSRVDVGHPAGCWEWTHRSTSKGYGAIAIRDFETHVQHDFVAHRVAWTILMGPIPRNMTLDHLCRNRRCVNPDHLQVVTLEENATRAMRWASIRPMCSEGHLLTTENRTTEGGCRECKRKYQRERLRAMREAAGKKPCLRRRIEHQIAKEAA